MAPGFSHPRVSKNSQNTQLSYELPHRIHTTKVYPLPSPNGSTIILQGNEDGVRIIWRGGRPFKLQREINPKTTQTNGANKVISLDSDEDEPSKPPFEDKPEFEDEEEEIDPRRPYPSILQTLDLQFGTDVLHISLLPSSTLKADGTPWRGIDPLKQKIVFTAACGDNTVRLITLPLTPPSPLSKDRDEFRLTPATANVGNGKWGETMIILTGHQKTSDGITMTVDFEGKQASTKDDSNTASETQIIVASHSKEITGLLQLWRIPLPMPPSSTTVPPFQSVYMLSPAVSISFNPSFSEHHSSHLLVADNLGTCRIYNYRLLVNPSEDPESAIAEQGSWLISLYPGFKNNKADSQASHKNTYSGFGRKSIVDAKWVYGGKAVLVLLSDGEWGVWDVNGVGPGAKRGVLGQQSIKGGSRSEFSLTGYVEGATKSNSKTTGPPQISQSKFAPMTPGTRKTTDLFSNKIQPTGPVRGKISVLEIPSVASHLAFEESILFWLGDSYTLIPSLSKYWSANPRKGQSSTNIFNTSPGSRPIKLENVDLLGERCISIEQAPKSSISPHTRSEIPSDIFIIGEHRYIIFIGGKSVAPKPNQNAYALQLVQREDEDEQMTDDRMIAVGSGELDVNDIDRALARMENKERSGGGLLFGGKGKW
ncbi:uncharacterized protein EAF02_011221 [Botrytis sinoallii]|uniref:uncharacterized protein n=1 Tax=Botrytis sinoallii TaxID=1463999 RepID=UPI0019002F59|nr:uncharacterized protein EAF02_011221 [Botrytis sinoallii]KAF7857854.1 hypothetical protein EAF02_011221 [Botrytis sinoallii]